MYKAAKGRPPPPLLLASPLLVLRPTSSFLVLRHGSATVHQKNNKTLSWERLGPFFQSIFSDSTTSRPPRNSSPPRTAELRRPNIIMPLPSLRTCFYAPSHIPSYPHTPTPPPPTPSPPSPPPSSSAAPRCAASCSDGGPGSPNRPGHARSRSRSRRSGSPRLV